jgi:predicted SAM-dependent methyltransferase
VRRALDRLTRFVTWLRRNQRLKPLGAVKLNLGSGLSVRPDWVHVDSSLNAWASRFPKPLLFLTFKLSSAQRWYSFSDYVRILREHDFVHHDLTYGLPFPDNCCEAIYSSHFAEHIERKDFERLLSESHRVLLPGGTIQITTPHFGKLVAAYQNGSGEAILEALFAQPGGGHYQLHRYIYDFALMKRLLEEAGFEGVVELDHDEFDPRPTRYLLYVEGQRPAE